MKKQLMLLLLVSNMFNLFSMQEGKNKDLGNAQWLAALFLKAKANINDQKFNQQDNVTDLQEDSEIKLPAEIMEKIALITAGKTVDYRYGKSVIVNQSDIGKLISDLFSLRRINTEWKSIIENEHFWRQVFSNFFKNIHNRNKEQFERCEKVKKEIDRKINQELDLGEQTSPVLLNISSSLTEIIENEEFWKKLFNDYFRDFLMNSDFIKLELEIQKNKKILEEANNKASREFNNYNGSSRLWLKVISIFGEVFEDVKLNFNIRAVIFDCEFEKAKKLIELGQKKKDAKFWKFNLLQETVEALNNKKNTKEFEITEILAKHFINDLIAEFGIDINAKGHGEMTALMWASRFGFDDLIDLLLNNKSNIHAQSNIASQPLMFAAQNGHKNAVEKLIKYGADINAQNKFGSTALIYAIGNNQEQCMQILLLNGAILICKLIQVRQH